ncbi:hypothetical protein R3P38DRAFT_3070231 [Favolaschia claudopus]|uniref:Uncharacterized protein n=1 Tax=Favolaschia claudopus TaxID=2862362 RepID=A0AAW0A090_9AGAR
MDAERMSKRALQGILARMDRLDFKVVSMLRIRSAAIWAEARTEDGKAMFRGLGASTLEYLILNLLRCLNGLTPEQYSILQDLFQSEVVLARVLLAAGVYQQIRPCPFFGLSSPAPKTALEVYFGAYMIWRPEDAICALESWFLSLFTPLATAAIAAFDPTRRLRKPVMEITSLADLDSRRARPSNSAKESSREQRKRKPKAKKAATDKSSQALQDISNTGKQISSGGRTSGKQKKNRVEPYPPSSSTASSSAAQSSSTAVALPSTLAPSSGA